jgi:hypothetical protein
MSTKPQDVKGAAQKKWAATARPIDESAVLVAMRTEGDLPEGPWTFITDSPRAGREMLGPPAIYLALAGWAT